MLLASPSTQRLCPCLVALDLLVLVLGGGSLYFGAEWLVEGASKIAESLGVSPLLVGLTVVAYGTSAPEMAVSLTAALNSQPGLSLGNVVGSNIANVGLVLGITALIAPPQVPVGMLKREVPWLCGATVALVAALWNDRIERIDGALLLAGATVFTWSLVKSVRSKRKRDSGSSPTPGSESAASVEGSSSFHLNSEDNPPKYSKLVLLTGAGLVTLPVGATLFVNGAEGLARAFGVSETMIGLTIVAFGTSLPELSASVVAALKGHSELAVGNVVGSNLFNLLLVAGATALVHPLSLPISNFTLELGALAAFTLIGSGMMVRKRKLTRWEGGALCCGYGAFLFALFAQT